MTRADCAGSADMTRRSTIGRADLARRLTVHEERALLASVSAIVSSSPRVEDVFAQFAAALRPALPWDRCVITVLDESGESFTDAYVSGVEIAEWAAGSEHPLGETLTERVVKAAKPVVLQSPSAAQAARAFPAMATGLEAGLRAALSVPLVHHGRVYGALHLRSRRKFPYTERRVRLAEAVARQVAGAIANSWLLREVEREARERAALSELGVIITSSSSLDQLYGRCARKVRELMTWDALAISIVDLDSSTFYDAYLWATDGTERTGEPKTHAHLVRLPQEAPLRRLVASPAVR